MPVAANGWGSAVADLNEALDFLTGDRWSIRLPTIERAEPPAPATTADAVCLFSGGLDSLTGAIDLLEDGKAIVLAGHYEGGQAPKRQTELHARLAATYGSARVELRQLFIAPDTDRAGQARPLPKTRENTMRGRSVLFLSAGFAMASALGGAVPLHIPENGLIGINVPLTGSRPASLSTRTTHPYFLHLLQRVVSAIGLRSDLANPYRLMTKGEMLQASKAPTVLADLVPRSISCSHPEAARFTRNPKRPQGNCGYCYPCLIRQASLHRAGIADGPYAYDLQREYGLITSTSKGASLLALVRNLADPARATDVLRTGPIPNSETGAFGDLYLRGREEMTAWATTVLPAGLRDQLP